MEAKKRVLIAEASKYIGKEVKLSGWIDVRRDHGKLIFLDLRDMSGKVQMVVLPNHPEAIAVAQTLRSEWVVEIVGSVNPRPEKLVNSEQENGAIEIEVLSVTVLNTAETPAFDVSSDGKEISEELRLKYRYLDLRRDRMQKNMRNRHLVTNFVRNFYTQEGFVEIETPNMTKSTPEGSRDYIVPSRIDKGKFYALPQSPQQYKQLLMAAGFERYFQVARCFRDEDTRGDRQPEFTQIDMEMSFVTQEDVMQINEKLITELVQKIYPEKKIQELPFPRLTYQEAMEKYGSDKPDIRTDKNDPNLLAFCWVIDFPFFEKDDKGGWTFTHNPFSAPKPEFMNDLMEKKNIESIGAAQYDMVLNGYEIGGGGIRNHNPEALKKVFEVMGYSAERIEKNFHHMLEALASGTPPHGGLAFGFDRLMMLLQNEPNIREVIPFAKTGEGRDPMMESPSEVSLDQLIELGLRITKEEK
ncbi:MAG: aspartate--tRNA ligase [Candidatus Moranbacteria bacterium]|nr:aspartate--tRNA ligase [Candidatus Moranbacteria bacterium]MDD3964846.1 aspartate--tRNA ligase [Candidatus Moranbacteria bacterium]